MSRKVKLEEANNYQNLFNYFSNEHQLLLTIDDMDEIIRECGKFSRDWVPVEQSLPNNLETVWIANKKGYVNLGCRIVLEEGWHWAESNGIIFSENGKIISECESEDLEIDFWFPLSVPILPNIG